MTQRVYHRLLQSGYQVLLAGGCVRDAVLKREINDFDIATSAMPDQVESLFENTVNVGKAFGTIIVVEGDVQIEVTTFRRDGDYLDGRHPEAVEFSNAKEDAARRDFSINALFYNLQEKTLIDYFSGLEDLKNKKIKCVGDPKKRFEEDALRMLRALRFASQLGFEIEEKTWQSLRELAPLLHKVSVERIQVEIEKSITGSYWSQTFKLWKDSGLLSQIWMQGVSADVAWPVEHEKLKLQPWSALFLWRYRHHPEQFILNHELQKWKFSREQQRHLQQFFRATGWRDLSTGELIENSFEAGFWEGLQVFASAEVVATIYKKLQQFQFQKPRAQVRAEQVPNLKGKELGDFLKQQYWKQLEGVQLDIGAVSTKKYFVASTWRRLWAHAIDGLLMVPFFAPTISEVLSQWWSDQYIHSYNWKWFLISVFCVFLYRSLFLYSLGWTIGKKICGLRVVQYPEHKPLSLWAAGLRSFAEVATLCLGHAMQVLALYRLDRRHFSDWLAETQVVQLSPRTVLVKRRWILATILFLYLLFSNLMKSYQFLQHAEWGWSSVKVLSENQDDDDTVKFKFKFRR